MTSNKKFSLCFAYVVICSGKYDSYVTVSFSRMSVAMWCNHFDEIGKRGFARTSRRQQQLFEYGKRLTESISQRLCGSEEECGHFERYPGRGGNLKVVGLTTMRVGASLCADVAFIDCGGTEGEPQVSIQLRRVTRTWLELAASLCVMR